MKLYELINASHRGFYIVAKDEEQVLEIGRLFGMYHKPPKIVELPITDDMKDILSSGKVGQVGMQMNAIRGDVFFKTLLKTGKPPAVKKTEWIFIKEYSEIPYHGR